MSIRIKQDSTEKGNNWWEWSIWLDGPEDELNQVDHATYTLHPTFPNPVRKITTRANGFRLTTAGWGEFTIFIEIGMKDGEVLRRKHHLKLEYSPAAASPLPPPPASSLKGTLGEKAKAAAKRITGKILSEAAEHMPSLAVYVSGGAADSEAVRTLREALASFPIRILSPEDTPAGVPFAVAISSLISQADVAVFLLSGRPSLWLSQEIEAALRHGIKRIVPVLVGSGAEPPELLKNFQSISINSLEEITDLAKRITEYSHRTVEHI